ncbi:MAG: L-lactate permease [Kineosporiaceae bacterium]|nr:L-lactate permease [Kineosporiaceae bacterium]
MFHQEPAPVGDSLLLSALVALLPLLTIFLLLGVFRVKAHLAGLASLLVAMGVSVLAFHMPMQLALLSASQGAVFGLFPIMWIVLNAVWLYQVTVVSGRFEDLRGAFRLVSDDPRVQAIIIAFCFGGLLEALAGFGAPVAITGVMLMALGFSPMRAAAVVLLANTAPVAYGAIATPIITAANLTKIPVEDIGGVVGRQTPVLALFVPLLLVGLVDGRRGLRQVWPIALFTGAVFAVAQFAAANFISVELTDVIASLAGLAAAVLFLRVWQPRGGEAAAETLRIESEREHSELSASGGSGGAGGAAGTTTKARPASSDTHTHPSPDKILMAFLPYLIVIAVFAMAKLWTPVKTFLVGHDVKIKWPGLDGNILSASGKPSTATIYTFPWLSSPGTLLLICGVITAVIYRVAARDAIGEYAAVLNRMKFALLTVSSVLALAYVMNFSGQTITIGTWIAAAGAAFAFFSPILGWLGTAVTGSDTSANALFATLQQTVGTKTGIDPTLLVSANTSGGVLGKMISPQNLTIAATSVGLAGRESDIFRKVVLWSLGLLMAMCVLVYLQSTPVLSWMLG